MLAHSSRGSQSLTKRGSAEPAVHVPGAQAEVCCVVWARHKEHKLELGITATFQGSP